MIYYVPDKTVIFFNTTTSSVLPYINPNNGTFNIVGNNNLLVQLNLVRINFLTGLINLRDLNLRYNKITDISPLVDLVNLRYLDLGNTQITDISSLFKLSNLKWLHLSKNNIDDNTLKELKEHLPECSISFY
jgi:Leucine-rich repeat (LRR) protein